MLLLIDIMTLSCFTDANRSPGEGGGIGVQADGKEISTFSKSAILISQYYIKVKRGAQAHWLLAEMGLQDHPQTVRTELDPVDYRLEQISPPSARFPASASRLCRKRSASAMMREYRPMAAPFVERGLAHPTDHVPRPAPRIKSVG
jgi:hypothetical protein